MLPRIVPIVVAAGLLLAGGIRDRQLSQVRPTRNTVCVAR